MAPYFLIFGIIGFFSCLELFKGFNSIKLASYFCASVILILFAGLRNAGVGADDFAYIEKFLSVPNLLFWFDGSFKYTFNDVWMEPGYIFIGAFLRIFTESYSVLFLSIAVLSVGIASYNYYRYSNFVFLTLALFFVHTFLYRDINQIRSAVAAAIGLFLVAQIAHRDHVKIIVTILVAGLFHTAALSYFILYAFSFFNHSRISLFYGFSIALFIGFLGISSILLQYLPDLGYVTVKLHEYANSEFANSVSLFDLTNIKNMILFLIFLFYWDTLKVKMKYFETMMLFYFLAVVWRIAFNDFGIFAARVATFYGIVEVLLVPSLLYIFRQRMFANFIVLIYGFITLYLNLYIKEGRFEYHLSTVIF